MSKRMQNDFFGSRTTFVQAAWGQKMTEIDDP
jgi:hypothetical protein